MTWDSVIIVALMLVSGYSAFRAGQHRAMARMFAVLADALQWVQDERPGASAVEFAVYVRRLVEARKL